MKKGIAFFDFDGTLTRSDTLLEFIRFSRGVSRLILGFLRHALFLLAFKLRMVSNQAAKEKILEFFYKGTDLDEFNRLCSRFAQTRLPLLVRPSALEEVRKLKAEGYLVVVVSASPENWIREWADSIGVQLIASQLEVIDGKITGKLMGRNCYGEEKVRRILEKHSMKDYEVIYAYGDTRGDLPMLKLATNSFYKPFRK